MKWIEIIHLRSINSLPPVQLEEICCEPYESDREGEKIVKRMFFHQKIESDYCIILDCVSDAPAAPSSSLGLRLASSLRELGSVNHTIWVETNTMTITDNKGDKNDFDK
ncbi:MAG: hypothetical protein HOE30_12045, partial [Deltaproteobacteria bacterium]|nr:hypothetical protein [Deltaproteobacteria bacterium]